MTEKKEKLMLHGLLQIFCPEVEGSRFLWNTGKHAITSQKTEIFMVR
jgi:hypothetical protein